MEWLLPKVYQMIRSEVVTLNGRYLVWLTVAGTTTQLPVSKIPKVALGTRGQPYRVSLTNPQILQQGTWRLLLAFVARVIYRAFYRSARLDAECG